MKKIVAEQYERAKQILRDNAKGHNELAELLIEREVIFTEDVENIFGKRPWESRSDELMRLNEEANAKEKREKEIANAIENQTDASAEKPQDEKSSEKESNDVSPENNSSTTEEQ